MKTRYIHGKKNRGTGKAGENTTRPLLLFEVIFNFFFFYTRFPAIWKICNPGFSCSRLQSDATSLNAVPLLCSPSAAPQSTEPFSQPRSLSLAWRLAPRRGKRSSSCGCCQAPAPQPGAIPTPRRGQLGILGEELERGWIKRGAGEAKERENSPL